MHLDLQTHPPPPVQILTTLYCSPCLLNTPTVSARSRMHRCARQRTAGRDGQGKMQEQAHGCCAGCWGRGGGGHLIYSSGFMSMGCTTPDFTSRNASIEQNAMCQIVSPTG